MLIFKFKWKFKKYYYSKKIIKSLLKIFSIGSLIFVVYIAFSVSNIKVFFDRVYYFPLIGLHFVVFSQIISLLSFCVPDTVKYKNNKYTYTYGHTYGKNKIPVSIDIPLELVEKFKEQPDYSKKKLKQYLFEIAYKDELWV